MLYILAYLPTHFVVPIVCFIIIIVVVVQTGAENSTQKCVCVCVSVWEGKSCGVAVSYKVI